MQTSILFRKARLHDFDAIYKIWMQEHVNPFMTFEIMSKEDFFSIFKKFLSESDVYVLEKNGQVVATRRIIPRQGEHAHSVEFASFGVDKNHLKKGYGKLFYPFLINELKKTRPSVTRIELIQETDNAIALPLAEKMGFHSEVVFPDWICRETGLEMYRKKWRVGARFVAKIIQPETALSSIQSVRLSDPQLPLLKPHSELIQIRFDELKSKAFCYYRDKCIATCHMTHADLRLAHVQFWEIQLEDTTEAAAVETFLRKLAVLSAIKFKKVDLFVANKEIAEITMKLGFHCRGMKSASRKIGTTYYDELGLDIGFFNIEDAKSIIHMADQLENDVRTDLITSLTECNNNITKALQLDRIDQYAALYLENLAFQIIREQYSETCLYDQYSPWLILIEKLPPDLRSAFLKIRV